MFVESAVKGSALEVFVHYTGGFEKLIVAVDDILWCMQLSENVLKALRGIKL